VPLIAGRRTLVSWLNGFVREMIAKAVQTVITCQTPP
jgi:hypothetical protein